MKPRLLALLFVSLLIFFSLNRYSNNNYKNYQAFGKLPIQAGGRIQPIDTLARNTLTTLREASSLPSPHAHSARLDALSWLLDLSFKPDQAHHYAVFKIDHPEIIDFLGLPKAGGKYFSFHTLKHSLPKLIEAKKNLDQQPTGSWSAYQRQVVKLHDKLFLYQQSLMLFHPGGEPSELVQRYNQWLALIEPGMQAIRNQLSHQPFDAQALQQFTCLADHYLLAAQATPGRTMPPAASSSQEWLTAGDAALQSILTQRLHPILLNYAQLASAFCSEDSTTFNQKADSLLKSFKPFEWHTKLQVEYYLNHLQPFYLSAFLYLIVFLGLCFSWLFGTAWAYPFFNYLYVLSFLIHTAGLGCRIYIQGRPPVTNLYASAVFIGWAAVGMTYLLECASPAKPLPKPALLPDSQGSSARGFALSVGALVGFTTLLIAYYLSATGDTLAMVQAVLDTNFWLATHVVAITLGYSAMFLAGYFASAYILQRFWKAPSPAWLRMAYATLCFATLFSFIGTLLGGIWADQSWGRFWGWDPKENGALLIVLWCAICLHARVGKLVTDSTFMLLVVFGNIVTSWSWFGTNMLGIGLHSYGFMDKAFFPLAGFILLNLGLIVAGRLGDAMRAP